MTSGGCCAPGRGHDPGDRSAIEPTRNNGGPTTGIELVSIPAGEFEMGTDDPRGYPADGEGPAHRVRLSGYQIATTTVTNDQFAEFVAETGHRTGAEMHGSSFVFGGLLPDDFPPTRGVVGAPWWREVEGADWQHPEGPHSDLGGRSDHPVVHVTWFDAVAFCTWSGTRLPTEAEWERAARGGRAGAHFPWGDELQPEGRHLMNVFQGRFPVENTVEDGWAGTCPVRSFPPNGFGLHEVTGNVWEWCVDWFSPNAYRQADPEDPTGPSTGTGRVIRGGSYLCHDSYCRRYRVDARSANTPDSSTGNTGFRVARSLA